MKTIAYLLLTIWILGLSGCVSSDVSVTPASVSVKQKNIVATTQPSVSWSIKVMSDKETK